MSSGLAKLFLGIAVAILLSMLVGCQALRWNRPPPVNVSQIVELSESGVPAAVMIAKTRGSIGF